MYLAYHCSSISSNATKSNAAEFIQYLSHQFGQSLKTCQRWESALSLLISVLTIQYDVSVLAATMLSSIGFVKLGRPVHESNLSKELNNGFLSTIST